MTAAEPCAGNNHPACGRVIPHTSLVTLPGASASGIFSRRAEACAQG